MDSTLPYIDVTEFNEKVAEFAKTNTILKAMFNHPKSKIKTWEDLPTHLKNDLFMKLGFKPDIKKY